MTATSDLVSAAGQLAQARVLCIGDLMLDRFVYGHVERVSPEAPIPVVSVDRELAMLGGAGNVVRNLVSLGVETCFISVIGDDQAGREVTQLVGAEPRLEPHLLIEPHRRTTIKTRFVAGSQQLLRADRETVAPVAAP
ncbi:MAG: bifunctional heptose 7-phosphate kinase/heptose 1-phosphate adenyltransferase, partial [Proteobacteria bacterium]|nr:bifunctional heptose 7-phosphate kinase/heptose 1-phosphate adenyltransferase [Pseudomonadota bacterium]